METLGSVQQTYEVRAPLELRTVLALAGVRALNAREEQLLARVQAERGAGLWSDVLFALTRRYYPSKQARELWEGLLAHREALSKALGRDVGVVVAAHDYLANVAGVLRGAAMVEETAWLNLSQTAARDGLTGLYDKTTITRLLAEELGRQARHKRPVSLIVADIDHFKRLNDTYGHADGDAVLQQVANLLVQTARTTDVVGRFGGEEFVIILPETAMAEAQIAAERQRAAVEAWFAPTPYATTLSLGVATAVAPMEPLALLKLADEALYDAKGSGRNCVKVRN